MLCKHCGDKRKPWKCPDCADKAITDQCMACHYELAHNIISNQNTNIGGGSQHYPLPLSGDEGDDSPWHENAVRAMENVDDDK